jgi:hypothetical protein
LDSASVFYTVPLPYPSINKYSPTLTNQPPKNPDGKKSWTHEIEQVPTIRETPIAASFSPRPRPPESLVGGAVAMTDPETKNPAQEQASHMSLDDVARMLRLDQTRPEEAPPTTEKIAADAAKPDEFAAMKAQPDVKLVRSTSSQEGFVPPARLRIYISSARYTSSLPKFAGYRFPCY